jgi:hypothetical protein
VQGLVLWPTLMHAYIHTTFSVVLTWSLTLSEEHKSRAFERRVSEKNVWI